MAASSCECFHSTVLSLAQVRETFLFLTIGYNIPLLARDPNDHSLCALSVILITERSLRANNYRILHLRAEYVMRSIFGDAKQAPPPPEKLTPEETVSLLWKGDGSLADELLQCMSPYMDADILNDLRSKVWARDPSDSDDIQKALQKLRDEMRSLPCTYKCRHDASADLIHVYAYTKNFFRVREYDAFTSPPVHISPLDLGPKCADKLGGLPHKYQKTYGGNYYMGQLIFWHIQTNTEPDFTVAKASKGCLSLPEIGSFYAKVQKPSQQRIYGPKTVKLMLERMMFTLPPSLPQLKLSKFILYTGDDSHVA
ncbi:hypothetical protein SADUNF_Sadunf07G0102200 [Salix dunnii]|uniref:ATXR3 C-terminal domain-containing protein n=1 Tax=Salix dunnii TaxID=1413687 RepID=A0A835JZZ6_9ROSI|nr:hypothetical protein SADUNF_Sadunf07G0102200 [Salix dunnii]